MRLHVKLRFVRLPSLVSSFVSLMGSCVIRETAQTGCPGLARLSILSVCLPPLVRVSREESAALAVVSYNTSG